MAITFLPISHRLQHKMLCTKQFIEINWCCSIVGWKMVLFLCSRARLVKICKLRGNIWWCVLQICYTDEYNLSGNGWTVSGVDAVATNSSYKFMNMSIIVTKQISFHAWICACAFWSTFSVRPVDRSMDMHEWIHTFSLRYEYMVHVWRANTMCWISLQLKLGRR